MQLRQAPKYQIYCARRVSAIFIWYVQYRNIRKPNNLELFGSIKLKNLNKIVKIVQGHLYQREENYKIIHPDTRYCTLTSGMYLYHSQRDLNVILHCFMLQIIYTTVFRVKRFINAVLVRLFKRSTRKTVV